MPVKLRLNLTIVSDIVAKKCKKQGRPRKISTLPPHGLTWTLARQASYQAIKASEPNQIGDGFGASTFVA